MDNEGHWLTIERSVADEPDTAAAATAPGWSASLIGVALGPGWRAVARRLLTGLGLASS
jgi:hypothetical protein